MVLSISPAKTGAEPLFAFSSSHGWPYKSRLFTPCSGLSMASSSCWFGKHPPVFKAPPPPQSWDCPGTRNTTLPAPPPIEDDPSASAPPRIDASIPPTPDQPKPKPNLKQKPVAPPPKPATLPPQTPDQPAPPKLGQIFTPDQLREYNRALDISLDRVKKAVAVFMQKNLTADQTEIVARVNMFQRQAEQIREQDLATAVSLAKRADLLAQDLLDRLQ